MLDQPSARVEPVADAMRILFVYARPEPQLTRELARDGHDVLAVAAEERATRLLDVFKPDVAIVAVRDLARACRELRRHAGELPIVAIAPDRNLDTRIATLEAGADDCLASTITTMASGRPTGGNPPRRGFFGGAANSSKFRAAFKACGANFPARGRFRAPNRQAIQKYVACVRSHGYKLPNPNFSGKGPIFPSNIRPNKQFRSASKACQSLLTPTRSSSPSSNST